MVRRGSRVLAGTVLAALMVVGSAHVASAGSPPSYTAGGTVVANPGAVAPGQPVALTGAGWNVLGCVGNISVVGPSPSTAVVATATPTAGAWTSSFLMQPSSTAVTRTYTAYCGTTSRTFQVVALVNTFDDVPNNTWFTESAEWALARGITTGVGGTDRFEPSGLVTRADAVTFLWRLAGEPPAPVAPPCGFTDVPPSAYYATAVCWAVNQTPKITTGVGGVAGGTTTNIFAPNRIVNRSQYVTMMWRMAGAPTGAPSANFADVPINAFYFTAVNWSVQEGITTGPGGTPGSPSALFFPLDNVTRAQAVTFLQRFALAEGDLGPAALSAALVAGQALTPPASNAPAIGNGIAMLVVVALGVGVGLQLLRPRRLHLRSGRDG
jgi:hypothetical protein